MRPVLAVLVLVVALGACAEQPGTSDPGPLRQVVSDSFAADVRALANGEVAPEFGALDSGPVTAEFTRTRAGIALLAAELARSRGEADMAVLSQRIWDFVLTSSPLRPDGALGSKVDGSGNDIETMFLGNGLGFSALALRDALPVDVLARWTSVVVGSAAFLERNGNVTFYTNGNINIGNAVLFRLAGELSGNRYWNDLSRQAFDFALAPPGSRWAGFGLQETRAGTRPDGSNGAGFLAERGSGGIGFDADYTALTVDQLARLYLLNRDHRVLRVLNMLTNSVLERVDPRTWVLDTGGGTRHPRPNRRVSFNSGGLAVLDLIGCRDGLSRDVVDLGRATAARIHHDVVKQNEREYLLLAIGPPVMLAATNEPRRTCEGDEG